MTVEDGTGMSLKPALKNFVTGNAASNFNTV